MRDLARAYRALIRAGLAEALEYRAQLVLGLLMAAVPLIMLAVWLAVVAEVGPAAGWGPAEFIAYYVAVAVVFQITGSYATWEWQREIRTGDLSVRLLKPLDPFHFFLSQDFGWKTFTVLMMAPVLVLATLLIPDLRFPLDPARLGAFAGSLLAGFLLNTLISTTFGMVAFWTTQSGNLYGLWFGMGQFLSGWLAPLALFPAWFGQTAAILPFHSTLGFPVEILTGRLGWPAIGAGFLVTLAWIAVFAGVYRLLWRRGLARYEAVGS